jgi:hypothetical protein
MIDSTAFATIIDPQVLTWGAWSLNHTDLTLEFERDGHSYWCDLEDMTDSAQALDWIAQVAGKTWATAEDVGNLVLAINELLRPQSRLCSDGAHQTIKASDIAGIVKHDARQTRVSRRLDAEIAAGTWPVAKTQLDRDLREKGILSVNAAELCKRMDELEAEEKELE